MTQSSIHAAATRAAQAALPRPQDKDFDLYLIIDDSDDDTTAIISLLRERQRLNLEVLS